MHGCGATMEPMKVLLLEDDPELGPVLARRLRREQVVVDLVERLADADLQRSVTRYDCLVLDRHVPDGDAVALVRRLRREGDAVPVLLLTAMGELDDRIDGFESGADDYLVKPFALPELLVRLRALTRRGAPQRGTVLRAGDLELDVPRHRLTRGGVLLAPTAKESAVLEVLLERPGDAVSRAELFDRCWDESADPSSNVIDVVVGQLRRRLGPPDPIETVRGVGYRLRADAP